MRVEIKDSVRSAVEPLYNLHRASGIAAGEEAAAQRTAAQLRQINAEVESQRLALEASALDLVATASRLDKLEQAVCPGGRSLEEKNFRLIRQLQEELALLSSSQGTPAAIAMQTELVLQAAAHDAELQSVREQRQRLIDLSVDRTIAKMQQKSLVFSFEAWGAWSSQKKRVRSLTTKSMKQLERIEVASAFVPWLTAARAEELDKEEDSDRMNNVVAEQPGFHSPLFRAWAAVPSDTADNALAGAKPSGMGVRPQARSPTIKKAERLVGPAAKLFKQLFSAIDSDGSGILDEAKGRVYLHMSGATASELEHYWKVSCESRTDVRKIVSRLSHPVSCAPLFSTHVAAR